MRMVDPKYLVFDLDETLYPTSNGLMEAIRERIILYMMGRFGISREKAEERRTTYLARYGLTLAGLYIEDHVDVKDYMAFVHHVPLGQYVRPNEALDRMLARLSPAKVIFTNSDVAHSRRVLSALGVSESHFELIFDFEAMGCNAKPHPESYRRLLERIGAQGRRFWGCPRSGYTRDPSRRS
ncbi:MAG: HAD hydrolase-like protein, partial [Firmicutes bacterium]|nr:HAD hydrolase-like protein [Bacillota bacterium]